MTPVSAADVTTAIQRLAAITPATVSEVITNPKDLANDLAIILDVLKVAAVFFPEVGVVLTIGTALETFLPEIEGSVVFLETFGQLANIHISPDLNPQLDAQMSTGR